MFIQLNRSSFQDISPACLTNKEPCGNLGNTDSGGVGLEKHTYMATIDFTKGLLKAMKDSGVCAFRFYFEEAQRNSGITTGAANTLFVIDAEIELCNLQNSISPIGDNSPQFRNNPIVYRCCNMPVYYNGGIVDIDGDSLAFYMVTAIKGIDSLTSFAPPHNPTTWPMTGHCRTPSPCACRANRKPIEGFCFDPTTADYMFHPINCSQSGILVFKVDQYRLDTLAKQWLYIGFTKREIQMRINNCGGNNPPILKDISNPTICEGKEICMTIVAEDEEFAGSSGVQQWKDTIDLTWNNGMPGANFKVGDPYFTFTNGVTVAVREVEVCWQTKEGDGREAPYIFAVTARDRACPMNVVSSRNYAFKVKRTPRFQKEFFADSCGNPFFSFMPKDTVFKKGPFLYDWSLYDSSNALIASRDNQSDIIELNYYGRYFLEYNAMNLPENCQYQRIDTFDITPESILGYNPFPKFSVLENDEQCLGGNSFIMKEESTLPVSYTRKWKFDDGTIDSVYSPTKTFQIIGTCEIMLIYSSQLGCSDTFIRTVVVHPSTISYSIEGGTLLLLGDGPHKYFTKNQLHHSYNWSAENCQILSGQNTNEINVLWTDTGWQSVSYIVSNQYGCKDSASMEVYVGDSSTLSVKFLSDVFGIHIYPNPVKSLLQIESQKELVKLIVIDSKGAMILTQDFTETLDVSHLKSGIYILQLYDLEGKIFAHKFVKE